MVHQGQGLPLGLEPGEDLAAVHARLDDLERDHAPHRPRLLGHVDRAHAPFADLLQQLVWADDRARLVRFDKLTTEHFCRVGRVDETVGDLMRASSTITRRRSSAFPPHA